MHRSLPATEARERIPSPEGQRSCGRTLHGQSRASDEATAAVIDALNALAVPYLLVGSFASNFYGIPRSTQDADFVGVEVVLGGVGAEEAQGALGVDEGDGVAIARGVAVAEDEGVGTRAGYCEGAGALRDIVQNHLLQVLSLVAMEPSPE